MLCLWRPNNFLWTCIPLNSWAVDLSNVILTLLKEIFNEPSVDISVILPINNLASSQTTNKYSHKYSGNNVLILYRRLWKYSIRQHCQMQSLLYISRYFLHPKLQISINDKLRKSQFIFYNLYLESEKVLIIACYFYSLKLVSKTFIFFLRNTLTDFSVHIESVSDTRILSVMFCWKSLLEKTLYYWSVE